VGGLEIAAASKAKKWAEPARLPGACAASTYHTDTIYLTRLGMNWVHAAKCSAHVP